jgi:hypothetical protein
VAAQLTASQEGLESISKYSLMHKGEDNIKTNLCIRRNEHNVKWTELARYMVKCQVFVMKVAGIRFGSRKHNNEFMYEIYLFSRQ